MALFMHAYKNLRRYLDTVSKAQEGMSETSSQLCSKVSRASWFNVRLPNLPPLFRRQIFTHTNSYQEHPSKEEKNEKGRCL
jgi:hypothetical protein